MVLKLVYSGNIALCTNVVNSCLLRAVKYSEIANKDHLRKTIWTLFKIHISLWTVLNSFKVDKSGYYHFFLSLVLPYYRCLVNAMLRFVSAGEFSEFLHRMTVRHTSTSDLVLLLFVFSSESWVELSKTALTLVLCFYGVKEKGGRCCTFQSANPKAKGKVTGHCNFILHKAILNSFKFKEHF